MNTQNVNTAASESSETWVNPALTDTREPVRMETIEAIAEMAKGTERPALIWGNTDRAITAAEALWVFCKAHRAG